jgi:excisionase family DNA binding protein
MPASSGNLGRTGVSETRTYTPEEYALQLRVSVKTVYRQLKAGKIRGAERVGHQWRIVRLISPNSGSEKG